MAQSSYDACLTRLLAHEGGYTNDPRDPGGPTNFGITIYDYRKYMKPGASAADVKVMRVDEARTIYRSKYWIANALSCDDLPAGIDDSIFDYRVNSGIGRADKVLRRVIGLHDDASNAAVLLALLKRDPAAVINALNDERLTFLKSLKTWPAFGKGWERRVNEVRAFSLQLAAAAKTSAAVPQPQVGTNVTLAQANEAQGKGVVPLHPAVKAAIENKTTVAKGGTVVGAGSGVAALDWIKAHPLETAVIAGGAAIIIGAAIYAIERHHQSKQEAVTPGIRPVPAIS